MQRTYEENELPSVVETLLETLEQGESATVVSLSGDLGAGKTTLTQALAAALGVSESVVSPTFVIMKKYQTADGRFKTLYHLDAYRIENVNELAPLGWQRIVSDPDALIVVEWGERIRDALPSGAHFFTIEHAQDARTIHAEN
jgi:tRNA threonylcarbamoyladenosine biosynthesis protein TsaE